MNRRGSNPLDDIAEVRLVTLADARALEENPPAAMTDRMKRNLAQFTTQYRTTLRARQTESYGKAVEQIKESHAAVEERLTDAHRRVTAIQTAVKHGRMEPDDATAELTTIFRSIKEQRALLDSIDQSAASAWEMVSTDPALYQQQMADRFPTVKRSLPTLSVAWLAGEDDTDPFIERD